jgi:hypothetical protein
MAEETVQTEQTQSEPTGMETISKNSGGIVPEAFDSWFKLPEEKAQEPKEKKEEKAPPPKGEPKQETGAEKKPEEKPDPLMSAFTREDGNFDLDAFSTFAAPIAQQETSPVDLKAEEKPPEKQEVPIWQKRLDEEKEYVSNVHDNTLGWAEAVRNLVAQGHTLEAAVEYVERVLTDKSNQHVTKWKAEREYKFQSEERERAAKEKAEAEESAALPVRSKTNMSRIISSLPGKTDAEKTQLFNNVLFGKDVGAHILDYEFQRTHPGVGKLPVEQQKQLAEKFITGITSDYRALSYFFDRALDKAARMNLPKLNQRVAAAAEAATNANRLAAQRRPGGAIGRQAQQEKPGGPDWTGYFASPEKMADRIN